MNLLPKIGAHVSVSGGLWRAPENARAIGAECFQIFGASPRIWKVGQPDKRTAEKFSSALQENGLKSFYLHASYLVNLASPDKNLFKKSYDNLGAHFAIANLLGARGLIFHLGSTRGGDRKKMLDQEASAMRAIIKDVPGPSHLIMENTAGGGNKVGSSDDVKYLYEKTASPRVKVCLDTAHALESGMIDEYTSAKLKTFLKSWEDAIGSLNIPVLHVNDSKTPAGSKSDRHENIGKGKIGLAGFKALAAEKMACAADWILEVPGFDGNGPDKINVDILRDLFLQ